MVSRGQRTQYGVTEVAILKESQSFLLIKKRKGFDSFKQETNVKNNQRSVWDPEKCLGPSSRLF